MKLTRTNSKGFSATMLIVACLVVIVIGAAGWYVFLHNSSSTKDSSSPTSDSQQAATTKADNQNQQYSPLVVSEWSIQMPLSAPISDAYYVVSTSSQDESGQPNTMLLGLKSLDSAGCAAAQANKGGHVPLGMLLRNKADATDPVSGVPYTQKYPNGTLIGGYYYAFDDLTKNQTCASQPQLQSISQAFSSAAKNITVSQ